MIKHGADWLRDNFARAEWAANSKFPELFELSVDGVLLAWVEARPAYCDRGHWKGMLEFSPGNPFDGQDVNPCYYMRMNIAMQELEEKLMWRVCKKRVTE